MAVSTRASRLAESPAGSSAESSPSSESSGGGSQANKTKGPTPPLVLLAVSVCALTLALLCTLDMHWPLVTRATIAASGEAHVVPPSLLLAIRSLFALAIFATLFARICTRHRELLVPPLHPRSELQPCEFRMGGPAALSTFTVQSWTLQGVYFAGAALCSAAEYGGVSSEGVSPEGETNAAAWHFFARFLWICYELSFSNALLVTSAVTFYLIPAVLKSGQVPQMFFGWSQQASLVQVSYKSRTSLVQASYKPRTSHIQATYKSETTTRHRLFHRLSPRIAHPVSPSMLPDTPLSPISLDAPGHFLSPQSGTHAAHAQRQPRLHRARAALQQVAVRGRALCIRGAFSSHSHPFFPYVAPHSSHISANIFFQVLWGVYYAFFSWYWLRRTGVCYYPFADPTLPPHISCSLYMGVLAVLSGAFAVGNGVTTLATAAPIPLRLLLVAFGAWNLMWTPLRGVPQPAAYMLAGKS